jgi:thymidylate synthase
MFHIIFAQDEDGTIGNSETNSLPWPREVAREDMQYFRKTTIGNGKNAVIMGHNTFRSLPRGALPGRANLVISRNSDADEFKHVEKVGESLYDMMDYCMRRKFEEVYIIGGCRIYQQCMDVRTIRNRIYKVHQSTIAGRYNGDRKWNFELSSLNGFILESQQHLDDQCRVDVFRHDNYEEDQFLLLINDVLQRGVQIPDRTGVGTRSCFGRTLRFDLSHGTIPLLTTKRVFFRGSVEEMLFFISGSTDVEKLRAKGIHIWDGNTSREFLDRRGLATYPEWDMGPTYSFLFKHAGYEGQYVDKNHNYDGKGIDQFRQLVDGIRQDPYSRRHMINLWSPAHLDKMSLPPCLFNYIFYVCPSRKIHLMCTMRSADLFLGVPFNLSGASLILRMVCHLTGYDPGELLLVMSNAHLYENHVEQAAEQIRRTPYRFPVLNIRARQQQTMDDFLPEDFELLGYKCHPRIPAPMAI